MSISVTGARRIYRQGKVEVHALRGVAQAGE